MPAHRFQLHLVTEPRQRADDLIRAVACALDGGVDWVQLRDKSASAAALHAQASALQQLTCERGARLAINDRLDVALAVGADAVHLAGQSLPVNRAVDLAQQTAKGSHRLLVGRSVHGLGEALEAAGAGADYLTFGHVFPTSSHPGLAPRGLQELSTIVAAVDVPVLAIGGISVGNLDSVLATGCAGIAVISAVLGQPDPQLAATRLRSALDASAHQPRCAFTFQGKQDAAHRQPTTL